MSPSKTNPEKAHPAPPAPTSGAGRTQPVARQPRLYTRFHWTQRFAHAMLLVSFTMLAVTGLPQKYAQTAWADAMIRFFGGIDTTRLIHHTFAAILTLLAIYHLLDLGNKIFVRRIRPTILPTFKDVRDALQTFLYNIGLRKTRPQMGRYTFEEKVEYWALIWGILIMGLTGFIMWNPIFVTKFLSGEVIPASKAAHGGEALLAVMAIVVWHAYGVHLRRFNKSMWTGKLTEEEMLHEHPLELADIKAGLAERPVDKKTLRRRRKLYYPIAGLLTVIMLLGLYGFVNGEKTAINTVLPISSPVAIYSPETPTPFPTLQPTAASGALTGPLTWDGSVGAILQAKCGMCHGASSANNGLSFASYASAMQGAQDGAVIIPGNVSGSKLIVIQSANDHPGQLSAAELAFIESWIAAGAPEK